MAIVCSSAEGLNKLVVSLTPLRIGTLASQSKTKIFSIDQFKPLSTINLREVDIEQVDDFIYLGRNFSANSTLETEISSCLQKAVGASNPFSIASQKCLSNQTQNLQTNSHSDPRDIPQALPPLHPQHPILPPTAKFPLNPTPMQHLLHQSYALINRLRWLGHLVRMDNGRFPHKALCSRLSGDHPKAGISSHGVNTNSQ